MKLFLVLTFLMGFCQISPADIYQIALYFNGKASVPSLQDGTLIQKVLPLVESSNFHSGPGDKYHFFTLHQVQSDYRATVAGKYLVAVFSIPRRIKTIGGEITVTEIIVGLNRDDYASSLFTVDEAGCIVEHSKYSGEKAIDLFKTVEQLRQK